MAECFDDNEALALLDGKLPPARRATVESHLESCAACRELLVALAKDDEDPERAVETERAPVTRAFGRTGHYKIEQEVGSGAAGTVFRALDERSGEVVALKYVSDPSWRLRFRREIETLARLNHPGIVRYIAHGETRHGLYLAMEWLDGEDLAKCIRRGAIPWPDVRSLGLRLVAALAHAHAEGAVHRDIGPRNIFLPNGRLEQAKLLDFGLVRIPDAVDRTESKAILGTPQYMAPEQIKDPRNVDARSDLFSLGIVLFEMLSGKRPFDGVDLYTVWNNIVDQPAPNLRPLAPTVPEPFVALIERMLAKDPAQRPRTAQAVHEALVRLDAPQADVGRFTAPLTPRGSEPSVAQSVGQSVGRSVGKSTAPMAPVGKGTAPMAPQRAEPTFTPRRIEEPFGKHTIMMAPVTIGPRVVARPIGRKRGLAIVVLSALVLALAAVLLIFARR